MPKRIALPDGSIGEFPDNMDDSAIKTVLQKKFPPTNPSRPAGLPEGVGLPGAPKAPIPLGMTSNKPGDSPDWRARLYGTDGSEMLKTPLRHVRDAALGLASAALHPVDTVKQMTQQTIDAGEQVHPAVMRGDYAEAVNHIADAIPVVGPWARSVENEARDKGVVPALLGLGTDAIAPEAIGKGIGSALKGAGTLTRLAGASGDSAKLAATRLLVPGDAGSVLQRALKPGVRYGAAVDETLAKTLPDAIKQNGRIGSVGDLGAALDAAREANAAEHSATMAPYSGDTPRPLRINGNELMRAQEESVPKLAGFEGAKPSPLAISEDSPYNKWIPAAEADELRQGANQKLSGFYSDANGNQHGALANPETARVKAVGDNIRDQLYPAIETDQNLAPGSIAARQQQFGRLSDAADIANKRDVVFGRHDPVSLAEKVASGSHGGITSRVLDFAQQRLLKNLTDSDALVRSAVDRYQNPVGTPLQVGPVTNAVSNSLRLSGETLKRLSPFSATLARRYAQETE
jgi:hypothetical protein